MTVFSKTVPDSKYVTLRDIYMTSLSADEFNAVEFYASSGYKEINRFMMEITDFDSETTVASYSTIIDQIQGTLERNSVSEALPTLYRGTKQKHVSSYKAGEEISFPFFLSSSTDPVIASRFAGEAEPAIIVINGVKSNYALTSLTTDENEVILSPSSRFFIDKVTQGVTFQAEYDSSGFYAPERKNVTVVEMTVL